jgi:hypothetical protein
MRRRTAGSGSYRRCANIACFDLAWNICRLTGLQSDGECVSKIKTIHRALRTETKVALLKALNMAFG